MLRISASIRGRIMGNFRVLVSFVAVFVGAGLAAAFWAIEESDAERARKADAATSVFGDWRVDHPGLRHRITLEDLPPPYATRSASNGPREAKRPADPKLRVPDGFTVNLFAEGLDQPRTLRAAPNGDIFVAEMAAGNVRVLRPSAGGSSAAKTATYASGLSTPFGIAFFPEGPDPKWVYVAEDNRVIRFAYTNGDLAARSAPEVIVGKLAPTAGGHVTRDVAFSKDGTRMFISVGSEFERRGGHAQEKPGGDQEVGSRARPWSGLGR